MSSECREILSVKVFLDSHGRKVDTGNIDTELECVNQSLQAHNMFIYIDECHLSTR